MKSKKEKILIIVIIAILLIALIFIVYFYNKKGNDKNGQANGIPNGISNGGQGNMGSSASTVELSANTKITDKQSLSGNYSSISNDESVFLVNQGGNLDISNSTISKMGDTSNTENSEFYGLNAGIVAQTKGTIDIYETSIVTNGSGANAVFATGTNAIINITNSKITTFRDSSRGLDATYGGKINADTLSILTAGAHCAAVATDRGEGTITVKNSSLNTTGEGSPCIYSTGNITATDTKGKAKGSAIAVIEGKNSITLTGCNFTASGVGRANGGIDNSGVMVYQSMSGDANTGTGSFSATDTQLSILEDSSVYKTAPMFLSTNTNAVFNLKNVSLNYGSGILLNATGNSGEWGNAGSNGATVTFNADTQNLTGNITCDNISKVTLKLNNNSNFIGAIDKENVGDVSITMDATSKLEITSDIYVTALTDADTNLLNIKSNGHTIYYDASNSSNSWLNSNTIILSDGGTLSPM